MIGLHDQGYGLLLEQCSFSAGIMYAMWLSMEHPQDPFTVLPALPVDDKWKKWTPAKIRKDIIESSNISFEKESRVVFLMN